ncbi:MAG: 23S rRNA (uracil(1939)-C(5))-methyltransferase RlmD [Clostridia bacterium]|nr:23S rRNA (uracil(1939)-C(5))-methyltransferase RlmD [Clostridia bacterium]
MKKSALPLKKNDNVELTVTALTAQGSGVGRYAGMAVFVDGAAVGDRLLVHIILVKASYAVGIIQKILTPSDTRIAPACPVFSQCGGCAYCHIRYDAELEAKRRRVEDALRRIGGLDISVPAILSPGETRRYRNKAQFPVGLSRNGRTEIGFYARRSHRIVDCRDCALQPAEFAPLLNVIARWAAECGVSIYDETTGRGALRHIYLRKGFATGQLMVCLVAATDRLPRLDMLCDRLTAENKNIVSILLNINPGRTNVVLGDRCVTIFGADAIEDELCGLRFRIAPQSFFQVNPAGAELLYRKAADFAALTGHETLLDLYCGTGTIGLSMAAKAKQVIGVEVIPEAIEDAKENAARNGITNARFFCADASGAAAALLQEGLRPDVVVLDPPRKGCSPDVIDAVAQMGPDRVVYVSCDPATLARDCKAFGEKDYHVSDTVAVDMFPRTVHVESVVKLIRQ